MSIESSVSRFQPGIFERIPTEQAIKSALSKEVVDPLKRYLPFDRNIIPNRDPILTIVAPLTGSLFTDERVWLEMERAEHKLSDARQHLTTEIFSHGFSVQRGINKTPAADRLRDYGRLFYNRVPSKQIVLKRMLDSYFHGWKPLQVIVEKDVIFKGVPVWTANRIIDKPSHMVRITEDDELVWMPNNFGKETQVFSAEQRAIGWLTPSTGTLDTPYGIGRYTLLFLLVYVKKQLFRQFNRGYERQVGLFKVSSSEPIEVSAESVKEVQKDLELFLETLNSHNIALEYGPWTIESLTDSNFISGGLATLDHFDDAIMMFLVGETLTSNIGQSSPGSFAAAKVHSGVKTQYARDAAIEGITDPFTTLIHNYIRINFGDVDPEDLPIFTAGITRQLNLANVKLFVDLGGELNTGAVADRLGLGDLLTEGTEEESLTRPDTITIGEKSEGEVGTVEDEEEESLVNASSILKFVNKATVESSARNYITGRGLEPPKV